MNIYALISNLSYPNVLDWSKVVPIIQVSTIFHYLLLMTTLSWCGLNVLYLARNISLIGAEVVTKLWSAQANCGQALDCTLLEI